MQLREISAWNIKDPVNQVTCSESLSNWKNSFWFLDMLLDALALTSLRKSYVFVLIIIILLQYYFVENVGQ